METATLAEAFARLDPSSRALLHVSLHHGVPDERLARVLRTDERQIEERRTAALGRLAGELGVNGDDPGGTIRAELEHLDDAGWKELTGGAGPPAAEEPVATEEPVAAAEEPAAVEEPAAAEKPVAVEKPAAEERAPEHSPPPSTPPPPREPARPRPESRPRRRGAMTAFVVGLVAAAVGIVVLVIALSSGGDGGSSRSAAKTTPAARPAGPAPTPAPAPATPPVALSPAPGAAAVGSATARILSGGAGRDVLELKVTGLPPTRDAYEAWLFNTIGDAVSLGRIPASGRLRAPLPADWRKFSLLDVSREPHDGNPNHSGLSVLRVPISRLAASSG
jgi:hypothetical protein